MSVAGRKHRAAIIEAKALLVLLIHIIDGDEAMTPKLRSWVDAAMDCDFDTVAIDERLKREWSDYQPEEVVW